MTWDGQSSEYLVGGLESTTILDYPIHHCLNTRMSRQNKYSVCHVTSDGQRHVMSAHYSIINPTRLNSTTTRDVDRSLDICPKQRSGKMLSLVLKTDTSQGCHITSHPALKDPSSERRKKNDFHEVYVAPSNVAKCLVVEASKYLRKRFWKRSPNRRYWGFPGSIIIILP